MGRAGPFTSSMFSVGTNTSCSMIMPVTEARSENLPSIFGAESPAMPRSRMKPRMSPASSLAQTRWTSAMGELLIQVFEPFRRKPPSDRLGAGAHGRRVGAGIGFGQAEAADPFPGAEFGQVFVFLGVGAVGPDRVHYQRALYREGAAVAAVDTFDLAGDQAVGDVGDVGAAVAVQGGAEEAHGAHFGHDVAVVGFLAEGVQDAGLQLVLRVVVGGVADCPFFLGQLVVQAQRIVPVKGGELAFGGGGRFGEDVQAARSAPSRPSP